MAEWRPLAHVVAGLRETAQRLSPRPPEPRAAAAAVALARYGPETVAAAPALLNCAGLALSMPRLVVHRLSAGAARTVAETDLHSLPGEAPNLLRAPWLLESRRPEEPLFGRTACLGGYQLAGVTYLVGLDYPDGVAVARWTPHWQEEELEAGIGRDSSPLIENVDAHHAWAREAARFVIVLGLLLEAQGSPLELDDEPVRRRRQVGTPPPSPSGGLEGGWVVRRVRLGRLVPSRGRAARTEEQAPGGPVSGRVPLQVPVRGHIRRQRHGPGRADTKWVYVEGYAARRWVAPRPLRIEVGQ